MNRKQKISHQIKAKGLIKIAQNMKQPFETKTAKLFKCNVKSLIFFFAITFARPPIIRQN